MVGLLASETADYDTYYMRLHLVRMYGLPGVVSHSKCKV